MPCRRLPFFVGLIAVAIGAATPSHAWNPNELQTKYFEINGSARWKPKGALQMLLGDLGCGAELLDCKAALRALEGTLEAPVVDLFVDLVRKDDAAEPQYLLRAPRGFGPHSFNGLGLVGLGLADHPQGARALLALTTEAQIDALSGDERHALVRSLWWKNVRADDATWQRLLRSKSGANGYKSLALQSLARWGSDAGVEYCKAAFTEEKDDLLIRSCIRYLGERGVADAVPMLRRYFEKYREDAARALGLIGNDAARDALRAALAEGRKQLYPPDASTPILVGLINAGDAKHWDEVAAYLKGLRPDMPGKKTSPDENYIRAAAFECTLVRNPAVVPKVEKALAAAANNKDPRAGQGWVFALVALAQRGDAAAARTLVAELNNPKEEVRLGVLEGVGGHDDRPPGDFSRVGLGVVREPALVPALLDFYKAEAKPDRKMKALIAVASVRAAIAAAGKR